MNPTHTATPARPALAELDRLSLQQIEAILDSDAHYRASATRNYGLLDPLDESAALLFRCACGAAAQVRHDVPPERALKRLPRPLPSPDGRAWFVECPSCGRIGKPSLRQWRAVIDWNYEAAPAQDGELDDFPFFNLKGVAPADVPTYLEGIRYDLTLRRAQARKRREAGEDVGRRYQAKIEAYLGWVNVALRVLRGPGGR